MSMNSRRLGVPGFQRGFSLVEIMVAMVLGIVILLAVSEVFISNSRTRGEIEKTGRQIENGIYALGLMEDELANAGFWGEAGAQPVSATLPPLCPTTETDLIDAMGYPVQGELSGTSCANSKTGSDFIAVRRASTCAAGVSGCAALLAGSFHLQVAACQSESPGAVLLKSNSAQLTYRQRNCTTAAPIYRFLSRVYYVNASDELVRTQLDGSVYSAATALVDGIEIMRFEYGIDTDGDSEVDVFTATPTTAQWSDVVAVKVSLIARNLEATAGYDDTRTYTIAGASYTVPTAVRSFKRQLYSTTVHLRNVAGRREQP